MPKSCKCILDRMVFKGAMTEKERDKILRNIKGAELPANTDLNDVEPIGLYENSEEVLRTLEKLFNDFTMRPDECKALDWAIRFIKEHTEGYGVKAITRGNCMACGKELTEGVFFCKECEEKGRKEGAEE